jgi:hypothetical protein
MPAALCMANLAAQFLYISSRGDSPSAPPKKPPPLVQIAILSVFAFLRTRFHKEFLTIPLIFAKNIANLRMLLFG